MCEEDKDVWGKKIDARFSPIPINTTAQLGKVVIAEGVVHAEKRFTTMAIECVIGYIERKNGCSNLANVEQELAYLNGCKVRVIFEILKLPQKEEGKVQ